MNEKPHQEADNNSAKRSNRRLKRIGGGVVAALALAAGIAYSCSPSGEQEEVRAPQPTATTTYSPSAEASPSVATSSPAETRQHPEADAARGKEAVNPTRTVLITTASFLITELGNGSKETEDLSTGQSTTGDATDGAYAVRDDNSELGSVEYYVYTDPKKVVKVSAQGLLAGKTDGPWNVPAAQEAARLLPNFTGEVTIGVYEQVQDSYAGIGKTQAEVTIENGQVIKSEGLPKGEKGIPELAATLNGIYTQAG